MKPLPSGPFAFQDRIMEALIGDIRDPKAKGSPRLDALREVSKVLKPGAPLSASGGE